MILPLLAFSTIFLLLTNGTLNSERETPEEQLQEDLEKYLSKRGKRRKNR
ncbi:MAG: hypothetical protein KME06_16575 [Kastovskya adunca ATA6-11-RM4]|jgi:hypothetical protein|nr:hypothetical protein [Kastovskya adunca ATA6-11-RM4]